MVFSNLLIVYEGKSHLSGYGVQTYNIYLVDSYGYRKSKYELFKILIQRSKLIRQQLAIMFFCKFYKFAWKYNARKISQLVLLFTLKISNLERLYPHASKGLMKL